VGRTGGFDEDATDDLVGRLHRLSLLQSLNLRDHTLRLHDNIVWYLCDRLKSDGRYAAAHGDMVRAIGAACAGAWATLPPAHVYGWRFLIRHLRAAGQEAAADKLLTDYAWIRAKLHAVGPRHLFSSYLPEPTNPSARLIGHAIELSLPALVDPRQLAGQLLGRLAPNDSPDIANLLLQLHEQAERPALLPIQPTLTLPDTPLIRTMRGHKGAVYALAVLDKARVVSASDDRTLRIWDLDTGVEFSRRFEGHEDTVKEVAVSPTELRAVSGSMDKTIRLWEVNGGTEPRRCEGHEHWVTGVAILPDGRQAVSASMDQTVRLWDLDSGDEVVGSRCIGHRGPILAVAVLPNGRRAFTGSMDRTARLSDLHTGTELRRYEGHQGGITAVAVLPGGSRGITGSEDRTIRIWDLDSGKELKRCTGHEDWVTAVAALPNGRRAISGSEDGTMRLWDLDNGIELSRYKGQQGAIMAVAALPDGRRAVTASFDGTIGLWDLEHHVPPGQRSYCEGHEDWVTAMAVLPDGRRAITGSQDRTVRLWDLDSGTELLRCEGHQGEVRGVAAGWAACRLHLGGSDDTALGLGQRQRTTPLRRSPGRDQGSGGAVERARHRIRLRRSDNAPVGSEERL
jgi:WD40 repeat protein